MLKLKKEFILLTVIMSAVFLYSANFILTKNNSKIIFNSGFNNTDSFAYQQLAVNVLYRHGFNEYVYDSCSHYHIKRCNRYYNNKHQTKEINVHRCPGYPFFLAMVYKTMGNDPFNAQIVQLDLVSAAAALIPLISFLYWEYWGMLSGTLAAFIFIHFYISDPFNLMAEPLLSFLYSVWILLFSVWEKRKCLGIVSLLAIVTGLCVLIKGTFSFVPGIFLIYAMLRYKKEAVLFKNCMLFFTIFIYTILPWSIYASNNLGEFVLVSTQWKTSILDGNNEDSIKTGKYSPNFLDSKNPKYLYNQLRSKNYSQLKMVFLFLKKYHRHIPLLLMNKIKAAFTNRDVPILIGMAFFYFLVLVNQYFKIPQSGLIPAFPLIYLLNLMLIILIGFGLKRVTSTFISSFLIAAAHSPFYLVQTLHFKHKKKTLNQA